MTSKEKAILLAAVVILGGFLPIWWYLVFTGYYEGRMSPDKIAYAKSFLFSDLFIGLLTVGLVRSVFNARPSGYVCGLAVGAIGFYMSIHGLHALIDGTFPRDVVTIWLYGSNLIGLPLVAWICGKALAKGLAARPGGS